MVLLPDQAPGRCSEIGLAYVPYPGDMRSAGAAGSQPGGAEHQVVHRQEAAPPPPGQHEKRQAAGPQPSGDGHQVLHWHGAASALPCQRHKRRPAGPPLNATSTSSSGGMDRPPPSPPTAEAPGI